MIFQIKYIASSSRLLPIPHQLLRKCLLLMANALSQKYPPMAQEIWLYLVDDGIIGKANDCFMSCLGPTNILSFPGGNGLPAGLLLSSDTFRRECLLYGQKAAEHLIRLLAHGLCHVAGLDHGAKMDEETDKLVILAQEALEDSIL